jgi:O-antigen biosynthesis protein WbqP
MYLAFGKRFFDVFIAITAAIALAPLMVVTGILIAIFDPGPIFFRQSRVGSNGRVFNFYKFRSMPTNTEDIPSDRIGKVELTWVGTLIRRTNIDELPQLFNILIGDMSVVGPRPSLPTQYELIEYRKKNGALVCRPGLTGLAQISSFDGMKVFEKANLDGKYALSISLYNDIRIILRTFGYLLKAPPVY